MYNAASTLNDVMARNPALRFLEAAVDSPANEFHVYAAKSGNFTLAQIGAPSHFS
jgi:hypothetical protein